jgi:predicted nuclease of predicted toxin-antitoxin system
MRFHLDEHVARGVATGLRRRGIDVTTTADAGLLDASDEAHLEFARHEQRVVVTQDSDFLRLDASGVSHCGIVYAAQGARSIGELVRFLTLMHDCLPEDGMIGRIEYA